MHFVLVSTDLGRLEGVKPLPDFPFRHPTPKPYGQTQKASPKSDARMHFVLVSTDLGEVQEGVVCGMIGASSHILAGSKPKSLP